MQTILETERLFLRKFTLEDAHFMLELLNTEGWLQYIGDRNVHNESQARDYLISGSLQSYETKGFGFYAVVLKNTQKIIGVSGFIQREGETEVEIGYAFLPAYHHKGYAYEAAKATLNYGFEHLKLEKIIAIALADNKASIKILEKLGMKFEKKYQEEVQERELVLFVVHKN